MRNIINFLTICFLMISIPVVIFLFSLGTSPLESNILLLLRDFLSFISGLIFAYSSVHFGSIRNSRNERVKLANQLLENLTEHHYEILRLINGVRNKSINKAEMLDFNNVLHSKANLITVKYSQLINKIFIKDNRYYICVNELTKKYTSNSLDNINYYELRINYDKYSNLVNNMEEELCSIISKRGKW